MKKNQNPYSFPSEDAAELFARRTLDKLKSKKGWKVRVWNNIGWHWQLQHGGLSIHYSNIYQDKPYWCMLSSTPGCGEMFWTDEDSKEHFKDPNDAIKACVKKAREVWNKYEKIVKDAESTLKD